MSIIKIDAALVASYLAGAFGLPTQYENESYTPINGLAWAKFSIVPNVPVSITAGREGLNEHTGFAQIDINYPTDKGRQDALAKADQILSYFNYGKSVSYQNQSVRITKAGRSQGRQVDGWYRISITIYWRSRTPRNEG